MSEPAWLMRARGYLGFHETGDNHGIQQFVDMAGYGAEGESWCSIFVGAMLRASGYANSGSAMARSYEHSACVTRLDSPQLGCIVTMWRGSRDAGTGHVTFYLDTRSDGRIDCLGGNQGSGEVSIEAFDPSHVTGYWWPTGGATQPQQPDVALVQLGDNGDAVKRLQQLLGLPQTGSFDAATDIAVRQYQLAHGLDVDGHVGPDTWAALLGGSKPPTHPDTPADPFQEMREFVLDKLGINQDVEAFKKILLDTIDAFRADVAAFSLVHSQPQQPPTKPPLPPATGNVQTNIVATVFGGPGDEQPTAYADVTGSWWDRPGIALPYRFKGARPSVVVTNKTNGASITCPVVDVGPWNVNDPYWVSASRPQAESGIDSTGRHTNLAGIDLTPAAARALGISGKGKVDWRFASQPGAQTTNGKGRAVAFLGIALWTILRDPSDGPIRASPRADW